MAQPLKARIPNAQVRGVLHTMCTLVVYAVGRTVDYSVIQDVLLYKGRNSELPCCPPSINQDGV